MSASAMPADADVSLVESDEWLTEDEGPSTERNTSSIKGDVFPAKVADDPNRFMPRDNHRFVEIWVDEAQSEHTFSEGKLQEKDVAGWVEEDPETLDRVAAANRETCVPVHFQPAASHRGLRLLILSPRETNLAYLTPLPVSSQTFKKVEDAWKLPFDFLESILNRTPIATHWQRSQKRPTTRGATIRSLHGCAWQFCLTLRHDVKTRLTTGVLYGPVREEIDKILPYLKTLTAHALNPWLIPATVLWPVVADYERYLYFDVSSIERLGREVGMDYLRHNSPVMNAEVRREARAKLDFERITRELTTNVISLSSIDLSLKEMRRALNSLEEAFGSAPEELAVKEKSSETFPVLHSLEDQMAYLSSFLEGVQHLQIRWIQEAKAQMQNVYSLIGQRDNRLNFETAESSRRVAEASQRDSAAMKAIAEDSKRVALATQKDSAAMRVIAAVSVIFLPGTFTATLFSASFFNFRIENDRIVSPWIWLYSAVTLTLTVVVLGVWWVRSRQQEKDIDRKYGQEKEKIS